MEEFTDKNDAGQDKDIILPTEKKVTLQPIHDNVHVDDESDIQIAAGHANGAPIANISSDYENTGADGTEAPAPAGNSGTPLPAKHAAKTVKRRVSYTSLLIMILIAAALLFALLYR